MLLPAAGWALHIAWWGEGVVVVSSGENSKHRQFAATAKFSCANHHKTCALSQKCAAADDQCIDQFAVERIQSGQTLAASPGNVGRN
jgi:hypothetical protein